jgi:hypothetical protein
MSKKQKNKEKRIIVPAAIAADENQVSSASRKTGISGYLRNYWWAVALVIFLSFGVFAGGLKYLEEDAQRQIAARGKSGNNQEQSFLSKINPFLPNPSPTPTPQLAKEYVYAGSRLLAVEDANANAAPPADLAVWRPGTGYWYVMGAGGTIQASQQWGSSTDKAVPGDYDGDGKTDFCVFRASAGTWFIIKSSSGSSYTQEYYYFGTTGDLPRAADFDGDGKSDAAVYRPSNGTWYIRQSSTGNLVSQQFGISSDVPTPADYDGDGKADISVWRDSDAAFYTTRSGNQQLQVAQYGQTGDIPVPGDYDGDGKADYSVKRSNVWHILQSSNGQTQSITWALSTDLTVQNDYDGDGKVDVAVWRNADSSPGAGDAGNWYIRNSSTGQTRTEHWGTTGDFPVPALWRR